jgi:3-oxoadipate enol-lactonase
VWAPLARSLGPGWRILGSYRRCCDALEAFDGRTAAGRVTAQVVAVGTTDDPATPASGMRRLAAAVEASRYVELATGRHLSNVENPERLAALLEELGAADDRP